MFFTFSTTVTSWGHRLYDRAKMAPPIAVPFRDSWQVYNFQLGLDGARGQELYRVSWIPSVFLMPAVLVYIIFVDIRPLWCVPVAGNPGVNESHPLSLPAARFPCVVPQFGSFGVWASFRRLLELELLRVSGFSVRGDGVFPLGSILCSETLRLIVDRFPGSLWAELKRARA